MLVLSRAVYRLLPYLPQLEARAFFTDKAGLAAAPRVLREFRLDPDQTVEVGQSLTVEQFAPGDRVKVTGTNKGRGFQGVIKRHRFNGKPRSHGHPEWRNPGSIGPGTDPSRVIKGKRLPGRMGGVRQTIINLQVVQVDAERNLIFVKGGIPGARHLRLGAAEPAPANRIGHLAPP